MASPYVNVTDLRGGINDADSAIALALNEVTEAENVDFRQGMLGTKRQGLTPLSLAGSIFSRDLPALQTSNQGGFAAAVGGSVAVSAGTNDDATGTANHILIARITTKAATDVTAVDYGGTALTNVGEVTFGNAGRLEVWKLNNPSLSALNLTVTLAGAADCAIIVERWSRVDTGAGIQNFQSATGTNDVSRPSNVNWSAQFLGQYALAWSSTTTADAVGMGQINEQQQSNGTARVLGVNVVGMKPTTQFDIAQGAVVDQVVMWWALKGRTLSLSTTFTKIMTLMRHQPSNLLSADELWAQDNFGRLDRYVSGAWAGGVPCANYASGSFFTDGSHHTNGVSLHGKLFLALDGTLAVDILQLWDGTVLRFAGLSSPNNISVANRAGAGTYASIRYFRVRTIEQSGTTIIRRSEPSAAFPFTPGGANSGATITFPTVVTFITTNGETHWEVEASVDNTLFYRIATVTLATTTYDDLKTYNSTNTYVAFPLSENIGEYTRPFAARHLTVDGDRLIAAGSIVTAILDSRVQWSVLRGDDGVGNDERVPITSRFFTDIDALRGGAITYMSSGSSGAVYVFKLQQVHKLIRTNTSNKAYSTLIESEQRGSLYRAGSNGVDENGLPTVYFTDPNVGLCRFGVRGLEDLAQSRRVLMQTLNKGAQIPARVLFYQKHWLVWVALALDANSYPNRICCYNIRTKSWTDYTGHAATMLSGVLFPNASQELRPYEAVNTPGTSFVAEADRGLDDDGTKFRGFLTTRPYQSGGLYRTFQVQGAVLMARAAADVLIGLRLIRDLGLGQKDTEVQSLTPVDSETAVILPFDDATLGECFCVQVQLGDPVDFAGAQLNQTWTLDALAFKVSGGGEGIG